MNELKVTLIQSDIRWHDIDANLHSFGSLVLAHGRRSGLVILPEMFTTGFTMEPAGLAEDMQGKTVTAMKQWSRDTGSDIAGSIIIEEKGLFYNRLVWTKPDGTLYTYDKRHLFRMANEQEVFSPGSSALTVDLAGWRIRPFICYDLRFPVWSRNAGNLYDVFICCASWPASRQSHWDILLKARAVENQCYVLGVNRTGKDGNGVEFSGGSSVIDFRGKVLSHADNGEFRVIQSVLEMDRLEEYRRSFPAWMDGDSFTIQ